MTETRRPLFRPEAVEHHARGRVSNRVLDLREDRTALAFRLLMLGVLIALELTIALRPSVSVRGYATRRGRAMTVALPPDALRRLDRGDTVRVRLGEDETGAEVRAVRNSEAVLLLDDVPRESAGTAVVVIRRSVLDLLLGADR